MQKLILPTIKNTLFGAMALGVLLFLPAWTLNFWQAWVFIAVFMICVDYIGLYLSLKDPELLARRQKVGPAEEQAPAQKIIMTLAIVANLGLLVFCALDHRFGWSPVPALVSLVGDGLVALGLLMTLEVMKVNSYSGSTIEKFEGQSVISTGPYALVRHPMYAGAVVMVTGAPLALGSWWGLLVLVITVPVLMWRILDEEKLLRKDLPGYSEYTQKVHFRLVPYLW